MNGKIRKILALTVAGVMSVAMLAGCGGNTASTSKATSKSTSTASKSGSTEKKGEYKIAMIHQHMTNSFQNSLAEGADDKAKELGVKVTHFDSNQDVTLQISQIEQCIADKYDCIIFEPVSPDGLVDAAKKCKDAGIPVICTVSSITGWEDICNGYAGGSNVDAGEVEMKNVIEKIGEKGKIGILTGPEGDSGALQRREGYQNILDQYPEVEVAVEAAADWDTTKALETVESWKSSYPDLAAIVCENDGMAVGAGNALGDNSGVVITGVDASEDGLEAIGNGRQTGTVAMSAYDMGGYAVQQAYDILEGKITGTGNEAIVENKWVDSDNLEEYKKSIA